MNGRDSQGWWTTGLKPAWALASAMLTPGEHVARSRGKSRLQSSVLLKNQALSRKGPGPSAEPRNSLQSTARGSVAVTHTSR